jgi:hypothetical protein
VHSSLRANFASSASRVRITDVTTSEVAVPARASGAMLVLCTLAAGQFLMTLDSSVVNVSDRGCPAERAET